MEFADVMPGGRLRVENAWTLPVLRNCHTHVFLMITDRLTSTIAANLKELGYGG